MTAIERIKSALQAKLVNENGKPVTLKLWPALNPTEIEELQARVGLPLPEELCEVLAFCSGFEGGWMEGVDFAGRDLGFEAEDIFPHGLPIASDGCGSFWILDITPQTTKAAPVFFACHDPPVILFQSPDLATFLAEVFKMNLPPHKSLVDDVPTDRLFRVWNKNPGAVTREAALNSSDLDLRTFAAELPEDFQIVDLRNVPPGMGFSWGRYGPRTDCRRYGHERIFAHGKRPSKSWFTNLFGGR